jgi:hypothetical protein
MPFPLPQHFVAAAVISLLVSFLPFLLLPFNWEGAASQLIPWVLAFGVTGLSWMLFEGKTPPNGGLAWAAKLGRGAVVWGFELGLLMWWLPIAFRVQTDSGFDYVLLFISLLALVMGLVLSLVLSIYSVYFIESKHL